MLRLKNSNTIHGPAIISGVYNGRFVKILIIVKNKKIFQGRIVDRELALIVYPHKWYKRQQRYIYKPLPAYYSHLRKDVVWYDSIQD